ncbi:MAG: 2-oxoglutarate dehydrogenase complex dihydrolipoyllysine-residue succinyltransferase [Terriglobia bacterium]
MATKILVPELGESILEATVGHWHKKEGDPVSVGEVLVELETDKVDLEVGAERGGVLGRIERQEGEDVKIGDVLGLIEEAAAGVKLAAAPAASGPSKAPEGGLPTLPAAVKTPAPVVTKTPAVGAVESVPPPPQVSASSASAEAVATPSARRLARERGVDLAQVSVRENGRRLTREDVANLTAAPPAGAPPAAASSWPPASPAVAPVERPAGGDRLEERIRMSRRRMTIARRLVEAQHAAAMLTTFNEADMAAVMELRKRHKDQFKERYGVGLGISSFFVKAAVAALRKFPHLNAEVEGDDIIVKHYYDVGVAVGAPQGLVVPVLRDADRMSFAEIEIAIKNLARKAQDGTLSLADIRGGTFTISNGGVFGSLLSTPILNPPQVGILGLHKVQERPVSVNGQIVTRPMMYVALSYDHRIVDGLEAVQFLVRIKELVEDPASLLLES